LLKQNPACLIFINLPFGLKTEAFKPKGTPCNKRSEVTLLDADKPLPNIWLHPNGIFLIDAYLE
jgi:uncharacterized protein YigE (DUF2233 family)